ncbi:hypothetical protein Saro_1785 [Novosphingobium aromaticivorans DSM 12444]|uniref:Lipoprotein n=1 Tax=Novosphingobium aromaticivorans (strain ATCC 700278 / DSM 12444 / CCUG 56034 / CIP 105152 / NBRC 16084 / F199) TaxID=279238 RepID=Q2G7E8_NOVAD|nr:hypothetical protein Saro_1785 [Novosphingobium aromaticivorans DSM 12444]SCY56822.1 hypothetical protein SAMN05660666_02045 [Novosphingobium aromaticivorans]
MRRLAPLLLCAALAACSGGEAAPKGRVIDCIVAGAAKFLPECFVEDQRSGDRRFLTVRHKDGGFRRFEMVDDGRGVVSADGADEATARWSSEGVLEVSVANERYRFPARMKADAAQP